MTEQRSRSTSGESAALSKAEHESMNLYRRAVDYLAAVQVYLRSNVLLEEPLRPEHVKQRLLGHWGTCPGLNLIHAHLNRRILQTGESFLLITGPGHGAAAELANMYIEGTLETVYPELTRDRAGLERFVKRFSWPGGFPSHLYPGVPGVIHEGGELGYALATACGAVLDNPDLICVCTVGDGEAETGPTAGAWHQGKFLNPATDGAVLPVLHLNGFKIAQPTVFATMTTEQLEALFVGYGYEPRIVDYGPDLDDEFAAALAWAHDRIRDIQKRARGGERDDRTTWPMIVLRTPKGMGGIKTLDDKPIAGSFRAHQVPGKDLRTNSKHLKAVEQWMRSYRPEELFDEEGRPVEPIRRLCPPSDKCMGANPHARGWERRVELDLPPLEDYQIELKRPGGAFVSGMERVGQYLRDVIRRNQDQRNFRIVCPDEIESNRLGATLEATDRQYAWPVSPVAEHIGPDGRVLEVLSEHNCQGWLQGYLLTGRHGLFPCYEAFVPIVDGMMNQYTKFLKSSLEVPWRGPISSLNYILTSESWRQDHNGYSHQGPGFINNVLTKKGYTYRVHLPPDGNCLLSTVDHCLRRKSLVNLIIAGKHPAPQWLSLPEATEHCRAGMSIWRWASTNDGEDPQIILCGIGDSLTVEVMAAAQILREAAPEWRVRVVNVTRLLVLGIPEKYPPGMEDRHFERIFPLDRPVIVNFHGYTAAIKQLLWERPQNRRFDVNGYREEGTTTTPFDMQVRNRSSRFHLVIQAAEKLAARHPGQAAKAEELYRTHQAKLRRHAEYIQAEGADPPEIAEWQWEGD